MVLRGDLGQDDGGVRLPLFHVFGANAERSHSLQAWKEI